MVNEFNLNPYELKEDYVFSDSGLLHQGELSITIPIYSLRAVAVYICVSDKRFSDGQRLT